MVIGIGERLRHIRSSRSQPEMADLFGISSRTYGHWERSERSPDAHALATLHAEGWNVAWLISGEGPERLEALNSGPKARSIDLAALQAAVKGAFDLYARIGHTPDLEGITTSITQLYLVATDAVPDARTPVTRVLERLARPEPLDPPEK